MQIIGEENDAGIDLTYDFVMDSNTEERISAFLSQMGEYVNSLSREEQEFDPNRIRGKFIEGTKHLKRRKEAGSKPIPATVAVALIVGLLILLHYLYSGEWFF